jgi:hypothetical protein
MTYPRITGYDCYTNETTDREMTEKEYAQYLSDIANAPQIPQVTDETPSPD